MPKKTYKEEQIVRILREADTGLSVEEICRKHEVSRNTFYRWRKIYGGLDVAGAKDVRRLTEENRKMKRCSPICSSRSRISNSLFQKSGEHLAEKGRGGGA